LWLIVRPCFPIRSIISLFSCANLNFLPEFHLSATFLIYMIYSLFNLVHLNVPTSIFSNSSRSTNHVISACTNLCIFRQTTVYKPCTYMHVPTQAPSKQPFVLNIAEILRSSWGLLFEDIEVVTFLWNVNQCRIIEWWIIFNVKRAVFQRYSGQRAVLKVLG
jgi:hypothetical protein